MDGERLRSVKHNVNRTLNGQNLRAMTDFRFEIAVSRAVAICYIL